MPGGSPARKRASLPQASRRPNTLGLRRRELDSVFDEIDILLGAATSSIRRAFVRRPFRHTTVPLQIFNRNGAVSATIAVACRNLSRGGIAVLHSAYIHIGTRVLLALPHISGSHHIAVRGEVVRCQHFRGVIHDIGVRFEKQLDIRDMLALDPFGDWFSLEHVDPERLTGALLVVDPSAEDVGAVRENLRLTQIAISEAADGQAALDAAAARNFDLILCDHALPDTNGADFLAKLRARSVQTPLIMTTAETSEEMRLRVAACPASAFLTKPIAPETILRAVAEFLAVPQRAEGDPPAQASA